MLLFDLYAWVDRARLVLSSFFISRCFDYPCSQQGLQSLTFIVSLWWLGWTNVQHLFSLLQHGFLTISCDLGWGNKHVRREILLNFSRSFLNVDLRMESVRFVRPRVRPGAAFLSPWNKHLSLLAVDDHVFLLLWLFFLIAFLRRAYSYTNDIIDQEACQRLSWRRDLLLLSLLLRLLLK